MRDSQRSFTKVRTQGSANLLGFDNVQGTYWSVVLALRLCCARKKSGKGTWTELKPKQRKNSGWEVCSKVIQKSIKGKP